ncbi:hypothetical protein GUITHDRAFT_116675 [Guillardia theta CCMP2712]|uniref:Zinc finger ZPR1-type domain-containing protein n=3 Tax=Guillardia theta TaxID=55529 RepID=L1ILU6_GUITC|nr:hypothetical protein GUITHDRAFT_116675 [Guillardia theta CCMP2712]EKX37097.1 hypothetical protein GUITHDRAFT_116675 [Guillardia theta CCMP2712]|eukprot:XP_005824077.1 hypothetical protein GUITHDRAFT_116675 [Guillardia theta CCMP2712]
MSFVCDNCGYRSTDVKSGETGDKRVRIVLNVSCPLDWDRMVLKTSEASLKIPELELELQQGSMGSSFTTIEGLFGQILEALKRTALFTGGDSAGQNEFAKKLVNFVDKMDETLMKKLQVSLILDDPSGLSRVEPLGNADSRLLTEYHEDEREEDDADDQDK